MKTLSNLSGKNINAVVTGMDVADFSCGIPVTDLGFVTARSACQFVPCVPVAKLEGDGHTLIIEGPNSGVYPPGPGWLYVVILGDVPSTGVTTMVGDEQGLPVRPQPII